MHDPIARARRAKIGNRPSKHGAATDRRRADPLSQPRWRRWSEFGLQPLLALKFEEKRMRATHAQRVRRLAATLPMALALGACADTANAPANPSIIWNTDRVAPSSTQPVDPAGTAVPSEPPGSAATAPPPATAPDQCREFTETVIIGGRPQKAYGRACPQSDGTWRVERPAQVPLLLAPSARVATSAQYPAGPAFPATGGSLFFGSSFTHRPAR